MAQGNRLHLKPTDLSPSANRSDLPDPLKFYVSPRTQHSPSSSSYTDLAAARSELRRKQQHQRNVDVSERLSCDGSYASTLLNQHPHTSPRHKSPLHTNIASMSAFETSPTSATSHQAPSCAFSGYSSPGSSTLDGSCTPEVSPNLGPRDYTQPSSGTKRSLYQGYIHTSPLRRPSDGSGDGAAAVNHHHLHSAATIARLQAENTALLEELRHSRDLAQQVLAARRAVGEALADVSEQNSRLAAAWMDEKKESECLREALYTQRLHSEAKIRELESELRCIKAQSTPRQHQNQQHRSRHSSAASTPRTYPTSRTARVTTNIGGGGVAGFMGSMEGNTDGNTDGNTKGDAEAMYWDSERLELLTLLDKLQSQLGRGDHIDASASAAESGFNSARLFQKSGGENEVEGRQQQEEDGFMTTPRSAKPVGATTTHTATKTAAAPASGQVNGADTPAPATELRSPPRRSHFKVPPVPCGAASEKTSQKTPTRQAGSYSHSYTHSHPATPSSSRQSTYRRDHHQSQQHENKGEGSENEEGVGLDGPRSGGSDDFLATFAEFSRRFAAKMEEAADDCIPSHNSHADGFHPTAKERPQKHHQEQQKYQAKVETPPASAAVPPAATAPVNLEEASFSTSLYSSSDEDTGLGLPKSKSGKTSGSSSPGIPAGAGVNSEASNTKKVAKDEESPLSGFKIKSVRPSSGIKDTHGEAASTTSMDNSSTRNRIRSTTYTSPVKTPVPVPQQAEQNQEQQEEERTVSPVVDVAEEARAKVQKFKKAGEAALRRLQYDEALEQYTTALEQSYPLKDPSLTSTLLCGKASALLAGRRFLNAAAECCKAVKVVGNGRCAVGEKQAVDIRVECFVAMGAWDLAIKDLTVLLKLADPREKCSVRARLADAQKKATTKESTTDPSTCLLDCYAVMGLKAHASTAEVKSAFRALALKLHPDKAGEVLGKEEAGGLFGLLSDAHAVLSDGEARREHDLQLLRRKYGRGPSIGSIFR